MSMNEIIEDIEKELVREKKVAEYLQQRSQIMPKGSLFVSERKKKKSYYQKIRNKERQLSVPLSIEDEESREIILLLMEKKTLVHGLPALLDNIDMMEKFLAKAKVYSPRNYEFGTLLPAEYYLEDDVCIKNWLKIPDCQNSFHPEARIHETKSGKRVRSKSEVLIADSLFDYGILFKNETKIVIGEKVLFPDFEMLHPVHNTLCWWEHLGMLDDEKYVMNFFDKQNYYKKAGIIPGINLIITYETKERPLTHSMIDEKLREFGFIGY